MCVCVCVFGSTGPGWSVSSCTCSVSSCRCLWKWCKWTSELLQSFMISRVINCLTAAGFTECVDAAELRVQTRQVGLGLCFVSLFLKQTGRLETSWAGMVWRRREKSQHALGSDSEITSWPLCNSLLSAPAWGDVGDEGLQPRRGLLQCKRLISSVISVCADTSHPHCDSDTWCHSSVCSSSHLSTQSSWSWPNWTIKSTRRSEKRSKIST